MHHLIHEYSCRNEYLSVIPIAKLGSSLRLSIIWRPGESHRTLNKSRVCVHVLTQSLDTEREKTRMWNQRIGSNAFWVRREGCKERRMLGDQDACPSLDQIGPIPTLWRQKITPSWGHQHDTDAMNFWFQLGKTTKAHLHGNQRSSTPNGS